MPNSKLSALAISSPRGTPDRVNDIIYVEKAGVSYGSTVNNELGISGNPVGDTDSQTLTNKTLTSPAISGPTLSGTLTGTYTLGGTPTFPASVVTLTGSQTLTNKVLTSPTINAPTITNASITADAITGFSTSNTGTIYGVSVTAATISGTSLANTSVTSGKLNLTKSAADANGWVKKDYGNWQTYEQTKSITALSVPANSNVSVGTLNIPVGVADSSALRFSAGILGGFGGRIYVSLDNGSTNAAVTSFTYQLGNLTVAGISFTGFVYIFATTV